LIIDYHLHSKYSVDGRMSIEEACKNAIMEGIGEIAFTDHIDLDWPDPDLTFNISDIDQYINEIDEMRRKYRGQLIIKTGIEVGMQPQVLDETSDIVNNYPFDFVIASVHIVKGMDPYRREYYKGKTKEESYRLYYEETLELINEFSDFDVLGHLGYVRRYSPLPYEQGEDLLCFDLIEEILKTLIENGKGIEVNTSGYKHSSNCPMPSFKIIERYRELGGTIITIGSDAHSVEDIGFGFEAGLEIIKKSGFDSITSFNSRMQRSIPI